MALKDYACSALTGGATGALDKIDGSGLADGDMAKVVTASGVYWYHLNATSGATENSPFRISPDTNASTKRWHLVGTTAVIGALAYNSTGQAISTTTTTALSFDSETYDIGGFHEGVTNPSRFTIPTGVSKVSFACSFSLPTTYTANIALSIRKNGSRIIGLPSQWHAAGFSDPNVSCCSLPISVTAADYIEAYAYLTTGDTTNPDYTYASIQAAEFA